MQREENFIRHSKNFQQYHYGSDNYEQTTWYWNMNHQYSNGNGKSSHQKLKNASNRSHMPSSFQSFFRWFKKDEKSRAVNDISYPREITSSTDTLELNKEKRVPRRVRRKLKNNDNTDTLSPPASPRLSRTFQGAFSQSSSCDSVFSTASSFAFIHPVRYLNNRNQKQPQKQFTDNSSTENYQQRTRDQLRELDKKSEVNLRRKYQLYTESSDAETPETRDNTLTSYDRGAHNRDFKEFSLPTSSKSNQPDSAKLLDLSLTKHRRTSSDTSKDKKAGAYVHVKGKRKAPEPPQGKVNPRTLSPKSSLGRKKRPAPLPPILNPYGATVSSTNLVDDKEIKAFFEGSSRSLSPYIFPSSTSSIPVDMEKRAYVSPYQKIKEDRKLTDEQKQTLITQVSENSRKKNESDTSSNSPKATKRSTPEIFVIERGQLVCQGNESPKLLPEEGKLTNAPSSPISPRPWFKRSSSNFGQKESNYSIGRTLEKRKSKNNDKDLPELGYARNSFFGSASRFNIFARMGDDLKKKDTEKRKSQIGMPNISELDREAAEIVQKSHDKDKLSKALNPSELLLLRSQINQLKNAASEDRPQSAKDLINKFEAESSHVNRIMLNTSFIDRKELFGEDINKAKLFNPKDIENKEVSVTKSNFPEQVKDTDVIIKTNDLMGLWICPYCTLKNPNWKIICEACEKIKPYEKRFRINGDLTKETSDSPENSREAGIWDKKTDSVMKYFNPPVKNDLSKSASETAVAKSLKRKSPSRFADSPQMSARKNLLKSSSEKQKSEVNIIEEETDENQNEVNDQTVSTVHLTTFNTKRCEATTKLKETTPDFNEVRSARLAKFNLLVNSKKTQHDEENTNGINSNQKRSPEKKFPDKLDFSDPVALELEKERLREKIRTMNAKALAEKYPVLGKLSETKIEEKPPIQPSALQTIKTDSSKLGAIRKTFKNPFETRKGSDEKISNQIREEAHKPDKMSIIAETKVDVKKTSKGSVPHPPTAIDLVKLETITNVSELKVKPREEVEEIFDKLKWTLESKDGLESFKATLREKSVNKTNTLAINKILRNLENAIADGKFDEAAKLATDLAKMKVSLSVTRQKERPKSDIEPNIKHLKANVAVHYGNKDITSVMMNISQLMTVNELRQRIENDFKIPTILQKLSINNVIIEDDFVTLEKFSMNGEDIDVVVSFLKVNKTDKERFSNHLPFNQDSESDDEAQNEREKSIAEGSEGAVGGEPTNIANINPKLKIVEDGWECPLCTLINMPNNPGCLACSTKRPLSYTVPTQFQEIEYKLKVNEDLQTFFAMEKDEKVEIRPSNQKKNDLNRKNANRKSSDIFNILGEEKKMSKPEVMLGSTEASSSPNITKNKYRGVDNFNPISKTFVFPKLADIRKPVITNVVYKSCPIALPTKEIKKADQNHYQQLVSLNYSGVAPNSEKFECLICMMDIEPKAGAVLRECLHSFCRSCLANHIHFSEEPEIKCPFMNNQYSCQSLIQEREIRSLVSKEEYDKHLARSIRQAESKIENTYHCKTPNCRGWCIFEDSLNSFRCPVCTIVNCLTCRAVHDGINCKQYQDTLNNDADSESAKQTKKLLQELIDKEEAMNCPTCHIFLLKKWGCDWLKCSFCKTEICWVTRGPRWGPNGKGDTSAGCGCGIYGKKCSPKCNYCH